MISKKFLHTVLDKKNMIAEYLIAFMVEKIYFQISQASDFEANQEVDSDDENGKSLKNKKSKEAWESGCLGDIQIEYKFFKLLKILVSGKDNSNNRKRLNEEILRSVGTAVRDPYFENKKLFRMYQINCPTEEGVKKCKTILSYF